jgi:hypothetical protein
MIDTNQLLSITFALISSFTKVVEVPSDQIPKSREDLTKIVIGSPYSPVDVYVVHRKGSEFWIRGGVVHQYFSPVSFFHLQDFSLRGALIGPATLSSNQVVEQAVNIMRKLCKSGTPLDGVPPSVQVTRAPDLHFYYVSWPVSNSFFSEGLGAIEIDARTGRISTVKLWGPEFYDWNRAAAISNRVYKPDIPLANLNEQIVRPTRQIQKQVEATIPKWLRFCQRLNLASGQQTNVAAVNWTKTFAYGGPSNEPWLRVQFQNGTGFECKDGVIVAHWAADAAFTGPWADQSAEHWARFVGNPIRNWRQLASELNDYLIRRLGASTNYLRRFTPTLCSRGDGGTRCLVRWCDSEQLRSRPWYVLDAPIFAEFDLRSGEIKAIRLGKLSDN